MWLQNTSGEHMNMSPLHNQKYPYVYVRHSESPHTPTALEVFNEIELWHEHSIASPAAIWEQSLTNQQSLRVSLKVPSCLSVARTHEEAQYVCNTAPLCRPLGSQTFDKTQVRHRCSPAHGCMWGSIYSLMLWFDKVNMHIVHLWLLCLLNLLKWNKMNQCCILWFTWTYIHCRCSAELNC